MFGIAFFPRIDLPQFQILRKKAFALFIQNKRSVTENRPPAETDGHLLRIRQRAAAAEIVAQSRNQPPDVGIVAENRRFDQRRIDNRLSRALGLGVVGRSADFHFYNVAHAFPVTDDIFGQPDTDAFQRIGKTFVRHAVFPARRKRQNRIAGTLIAVNGNRIERGVGGRV